MTALPSLLLSLTARNAASSFVALVWLSLLSMFSIPVYIRLLGVSEWGLVAACASLQILSNFIDAGFSQIVPRWAAQEAGHPARLRHHVALFQRLYLCLGVTMLLVLQASAGYLAHDWFQVPADRADALESAIRIVSFQFLFQFVNNLYTGLWHGLQRQVFANARACGFGTLKHVSAMLALIAGAQQAWVYCLAFALVAGLEVLVNAASVWRMLGSEPEGASSGRATLGPVLKEVSLLSGGILVGLLVSQLDRIILSRTVDVSAFGIYTVVATLALAFLQLQAPVTRAYFPVLVRDIQQHGRVSGSHMRNMLAGTVLICTLPALITCAFAPQVLTLWLHDPKVVDMGTGPLRLLLISVALNSIYGCVYQVVISFGKSKTVIQLNLIALVVATAVIIVVGDSVGILLGGMIWLANTFTQLVLGTLWLINKVRSEK